MWEHKWAKRGKEKGHRENGPVSSSTCRLFPRRDPRHHRVKPPTFYFFFPPKKFPFDLLVFTPFEPFDKLLRGPQLRIIGDLIDGPLNSFVRLIFEMSQHRQQWHQHIFFFFQTVAYRLSIRWTFKSISCPYHLVLLLSDGSVPKGELPYAQSESRRRFFSNNTRQPIDPDWHVTRIFTSSFSFPFRFIRSSYKLYNSENTKIH